MDSLSRLRQPDRGVAQPGSVLVWGTRGRKFKSCRSDQKTTFTKNQLSAGFLLSIQSILGVLAKRGYRHRQQLVDCHLDQSPILLVFRELHR